MAAPAELRITLPERLEGDGVALRPLMEAEVEPYTAAFVEDPELGRWLGFETDLVAADVHEMVARGRVWPWQRSYGC